MSSLISLPILEYLPDKLNIRLFYYLKQNAKTYYSSSNIINSNIRSVVGINLRLPHYIFTPATYGVNKKTKTNLIESSTPLPKDTSEILLDKVNNKSLVSDNTENFDNYSFNLPYVPLHKDQPNKKINKLIDDLSLTWRRQEEKSQTASASKKKTNRSMQIFSLKYYWSNVLNPSLKKRDYKNVLGNLKTLYQGYYSSNIDALVTESNYLKLNLFSK